jgi:hypothetical protein
MSPATRGFYTPSGAWRQTMHSKDRPLAATPRHAEEYPNAGIEELESVIGRSEQYSSHSYHVLGSQGIALVHRCG